MLHGCWVSYITNFVPRRFDLKPNGVIKISMAQSDEKEMMQHVKKRVYLNFPMYMLLDLEVLSVFINIVYSVQVGRECLFANRRNLPFSATTAAEKVL